MVGSSWLSGPDWTLHPIQHCYGRQLLTLRTRLNPTSYSTLLWSAASDSQDQIEPYILLNTAMVGSSWLFNIHNWYCSYTMIQSLSSEFLIEQMWDIKDVFIQTLFHFKNTSQKKYVILSHVVIELSSLVGNPVCSLHPQINNNTDVVFSIIRGFSLTINLRQKPKGVPHMLCLVI